VSRRVRGFLFVDYVRMVRGRKDLSWGRHLLPADLATIAQPIDRDGWYPMEIFERLGLAILDELAKGQLEGVRMWGRFQVQTALKEFPDLLAPGNPRETLMRFRVLSRAFFDYGAVDVVNVEEEAASVAVDYGMSARAEETASTQSLGFFEGLLEAAGAREVVGRFSSSAWGADDATVISLTWLSP
jgi:hypothetical protein